jgi:hypothetical protein
MGFWGRVPPEPVKLVPPPPAGGVVAGGVVAGGVVAGGVVSAGLSAGLSGVVVAVAFARSSFHFLNSSCSALSRSAFHFWYSPYSPPLDPQD